MPPKTGPIPRHLLGPDLYTSSLTAQEVRALAHNSEWQTLKSRNSQVIFLCKFGEIDTAPASTTDEIGNIFNITGCPMNP
jgi:hypothetical protein